MFKILLAKAVRPKAMTYVSTYSIISRLFVKKKEEETQNSSKPREQAPATVLPIEKED